MEEKIINLTIEGITPFLMHKYTGKETNHKPGEDYAEEWKDTAYTSLKESEKPLMERHIVVPEDVINACFRESAKQFKIKGNQRYTRIYVSSVITDKMEYPIRLNGSNLTLADVEEKNYIFEKGVKIKTSRVNRKRAFVPKEWKINMQMRIIDKQITVAKLKEIIEYAGMYVGIGDWRPGSPKPGNWGRFEIKSWKES